MFTVHQRLFTLVMYISLSVLPGVVGAQSTKVTIDSAICPANSAICPICFGIDSVPQQIRIERKIEKDVTYHWGITGSATLIGTLEGPLNEPTILYRPPQQIEKKLVQTLITATVIEPNGNKTKDSVVFVFLDPRNTSNPRPDFDLAVITDRNEYEIGDDMTITVKTAKDCRVWLFIQDAHGEVTRLFPDESNRGYSNNYIQEGLPLTLEATMEGPVGTETLIVIAYAGDQLKDPKLKQLTNTRISETSKQYTVKPKIQ